LNILMVLNKKFPPDIRVEKEARSLMKQGHRIYLLASQEGDEEDVEEVFGITVIRIKREYVTSLVKRLRGWQYSLLRIDRHLFLNLEKIICRYKIDAVHVHDLPPVKSSLLAAKKYNLPVIADLHENYPVTKQLNLSQKDLTLRNRLKQATIDGYRAWKKHEKKVLSLVDRIIVVVPEAAERIEAYKLNRDKIFVVSNTEDVDYFTGMEIESDVIARYKGSFVISYIGALGHHRGVDTAIKAMPDIIEAVHQAKLLIVGSGRKYDKELQDLAKKAGVTENVIFTGWQPFNMIPSYIEASDLCLVPHNYSEHTDTTVPHKLFQYMLKKKPVVVSNCRPLKRIVEETRCGLVFEAGNDKDLAENIISLYKDEALRTQLGKNGYKAVLENYNWENSERVLGEMYSRLPCKV